MPRFTRETQRYFENLDRQFREIDQAKKREASSSEPSIEKPDEAPEMSEREIEIGALPLPEKKRETDPST